MINPKIQEIIAEKVIAANAEREAREPSGRLAASRLGWPLQWQMLHYYKVPQKPIDEYTLRKFARGNDVEERIMKWVAPAPDKMQVPVTYRGVVGFMDLLLDYPIEVKSVTNMAFKHIQKEGSKWGHRMQGELYAKATGYDTFAVAYVASDDYRVLCYEEQVTGEVDTIIDQYEAQVATGVVPVFVAKEKWHAMKDYNPYFEWQDLDQQQIADKLSELGIATTMALPL